MKADRLSPTQWAYLFDQENFLARLNHRANTLFENGYTVEPSGIPYVFAVLLDTPQGEITHLVNPILGTCTCRFFTKQETEPLTTGPPVACKHLRGLALLVCHVRERYQEQQNWSCYYRLRIHWTAMVAEERRLSLEGEIR